MSVTVENSGATAIRPFTIPRVPEAELKAAAGAHRGYPATLRSLGEDHIVPAKASPHNAEHYDASTAIIAFKEFPARPDFPVRRAGRRSPISPSPGRSRTRCGTGP
jgi:hypothetical protein